MEERKELEKREDLLPEEADYYQSFVHEVVTRKYQEKRGDPAGRFARAWVSKPEPGSSAEKAIHAVGDPDVVQELGEALESNYDFHGHSPQTLSREREAEIVGEGMGKLLHDTAERAPHVLPPVFRTIERLGDKFAEKLGAPKAKDVLHALGAPTPGEVEEAVDSALNLDENLKGFKPKFKEKGGEEHGS